MDMKGIIACAASPNSTSLLLLEVHFSAQAMFWMGHFNVFVTMLRIRVNLRY